MNGKNGFPVGPVLGGVAIGVLGSVIAWWVFKPKSAAPAVPSFAAPAVPSFAAPAVPSFAAPAVPSFTGISSVAPLEGFRAA